MATISEKIVSSSSSKKDNVPQWKKDLIARLKTQKERTEEIHDEERLWGTHHPPHPRTDLVCPMSPENGFHKELDSPNSSDSEDLHYGPGIVNRLRNKYLSLALRESNNRPTILRKATSLENLLDDEDRISEQGKTDGVLFIRRNGVNENGNRYRSSNRQQQMKRARSVEVISRASHDNELSMTASVTEKINNRQSLHEDLLMSVNDEKEIPKEISRPYKKPLSIENGSEDNEKPTRAVNRPKKIPPLLREREKPPVDVVKHAKMIFEKRPETRTKKPQTTGDVAAKVDSFNDIIVKTKVGLKPTKPVIKTSKPVLVDKKISNTHIKPVAKPVIINEELVKPNCLELVTSPKQEKKPFQSLPSPIPDVSRVEMHQDGEIRKNHKNSLLCDTPDLILTSSPIPKLISPIYSKRTTENFLNEERNRSISAPLEVDNKYPNTPHSPSKPKPNTLSFNRENEESLGIKMISPISQNNITKNSASSVFNFTQAQVDQRHLPGKKSPQRIQSPIFAASGQRSPIQERKSPISEFRSSPDLRHSPIESPTNGFGSKVKLEVSAFEMVRNLRNHAKSVEVIKVAEVSVDSVRVESHKPVDKSAESTADTKKFPQESEKPFEKVVLKPVQSKKNTSDNFTSVVDSPVEKPVKVPLPIKGKSRKEENTVAVFNFTTRKDVPDYIANDTSRVPSKPTIPKPDEPGIKILPETFIANFQEVWEEDELIRTLEARPPSPCDVTFINDNILIDGKSSLIQQTSRRIKLKISFIDDAEIYEYPSENSLLLDDQHPSPSSATAPPVGHTIPNLTGSSLASYTPKTTEEFQLGISKSFHEPIAAPKKEEPVSDDMLEEVDKPVLFSSGSTSDILF
ncbi:uncharacterized protein LOC126741008 isoform X2 [Anthonomus grandis grandis]|uniref:uncharacterized protein LOC126741008 isoform X2 n=1 Tax=Anthonomus grandis grandis TaxID=2921223 RepID=UPI0021657891|nr:uncharacterized protein LOC126741008 isoform X2 [Anthonomus grandis grandis]